MGCLLQCQLHLQRTEAVVAAARRTASRHPQRPSPGGHFAQAAVPACIVRYKWRGLRQVQVPIERKNALKNCEVWVHVSNSLTQAEAGAVI